MHYPSWLPTSLPSGLADWLILIVSVYEVYQTRGERSRERDRSIGVGTEPRRRYWPWIIFALVATGLAWLPVYLQSQPSGARQISAGTAYVNGGAGVQTIKADVDEPYDVFCETSWGSGCSGSQQTTGSFVVTFSVPAPHDGGRVEWRITPIPALDAYRQQKAVVADRDKTIESLKSRVNELEGQLSQQLSEDQNLKARLQAWAGYRDRVISVIDEIERADCAQQAIQANTELIAAQNEKAFQDANIERLKKERQGGPGPAGWMFLQRAKEQLDRAQSNLQGIQKGINKKLDALRDVPQ